MREIASYNNALWLGNGMNYPGFSLKLSGKTANRAERLLSAAEDSGVYCSIASLGKAGPDGIVLIEQDK